MKEFQTLRFLDFFQWVFTKQGIEYKILRKILQVKLTMDGRRVPTIFNQSNKKQKEDSNRFIKSLWIYALYGLFLVPIMLMGNNYLFQMSLTFGVLMFIIMTSMISDFSSVLLDVRDRNILHTKPLDKRTISLAKTLHICIYLFFLTAAIAAVPLAVSIFSHGPLFALLFLGEIVLMDFLIVVMTAILYFAILRFFDGEKLKDIINYVQIGLSIGLAVGYQFVARSFELVDLDMVFSPAWWQFLIPPVWFAAPFQFFLEGTGGPYIIAFTVLAFTVPVIALIIYSRIMPAFEQNLQKLSSHSGKNKKTKQKYFNWEAGLVCKDNEERAFYRFARSMMKTERDFKLKVYPSLGFSLIFPFIFIFNQLQFGTFEGIRDSKWYLSLYFSVLMIPNILMMLKYSGKYKGAWIYRTAPVRQLRNLYTGTIKAFIVRLFFPIYTLLSIIFIFLFGVRIIEDIIIIFLSGILYTIIGFILIKGTLPFSQSFEAAQESDGWKVVPFFLLIGLFLGIHFLFTLFSFGTYMYLVLLLAAVVGLWKYSFKTSWQDLK
jgi:ABC-2 type transport system permease protein